jgi:hypothetical protein
MHECVPRLYRSFIQIETKYFYEGNVGEHVDGHTGYIAPLRVNSLRKLLKKRCTYTDLL